MQGTQGITVLSGEQSNQRLSANTHPIQGAQPRTNLTTGSIAKAGAVILGTTATYYLAKATGIFSYFGFGSGGDTSNSVAKSDHEVTMYHGNSLAVEEIEHRFVGAVVRRSHSVVNPIPDQNIIVGQPFTLVIDGTNVFGTIVTLNLTGSPSWLSSGATPPTLKGSIDTPGNARGIVVSGNYAYLADNLRGLNIFDISDPATPILKGSYNTPGASQDLTISGNYSYVADGISGLQIIDISDITNPTFVGSYNTPGYASGVAVSGNYSYVADGSFVGLHVLDISNPANPTFISSYFTPGQAGGITVVGSHALIADGGFNYGSGLQIMDISNPGNPTVVGVYNTPSIAKRVTVSGDYAFVVDRGTGLLIINISNITNPTLTSSYNTPGDAFGVSVAGNYAFVADFQGGLQIINIANITNPTFISSYDTPGFATGVTVAGNYAYVADGDSGLQIIETNLDKLTLSGTPTDVGVFNIVISANDGTDIAINTFDINVINNVPVVGNPIQNQTTIVNQAFNYMVPSNTFSDPDGHALIYNATLSDDSPLPVWLTFNSDLRQFSGTPTTTGTLATKVTADDTYGGAATNVFSIDVVTNNAPVVNIPIQNQTTIVNQAFNYTVPSNTFSDPDGHALSYNATLSDNGALPAWLLFNGALRQFSGTPLSTELLPVKVTADDGFGGAISDSFTIDIIKNVNAENIIYCSAKTIICCYLYSQCTGRGWRTRKLS